jgi:threonine dehydrogenase-like Zn-dependent dehydrogenase
MRALVFRTSIPRLLVGFAYARIMGRPATLDAGPLALIEMRERELPGERWVRVRTSLGGICGTDLHMLKLEVSRKSSVIATRGNGSGKPMFPGHEAVGEIVEMGAGVRELSLSQRVVLIPGKSCATLEKELPCVYCRTGNPAICVHRHERPTISPVGGGWSDQFVRLESQLLPVPDNVSDEAAVLFEPAACSLHAVLRKPPIAGDHVLVVGGGTIGMGVLSALRALRIDIRITALTRHPFQSEQALRLGADHVVDESRGDAYRDLAQILGTEVVGRQRQNRLLKVGYSIVYDCVGSALTLHNALRWCRPRGAVVLIGVDLHPGVLDRSPVWHREIDIVGAMSFGMDEWEGHQCSTFQRVADWCSSGRLSLQGFLTHRYALDEYRDAIAAAALKARSRAVKVALEFCREVKS